MQSDTQVTSVTPQDLENLVKELARARHKITASENSDWYYQYKLAKDTEKKLEASLREKLMEYHLSTGETKPHSAATIAVRQKYVPSEDLLNKAKENGITDILEIPKEKLEEAIKSLTSTEILQLKSGAIQRTLSKEPEWATGLYTVEPEKYTVIQEKLGEYILDEIE